MKVLSSRSLLHHISYRIGYWLEVSFFLREALAVAIITIVIVLFFKHKTRVLLLVIRGEREDSSLTTPRRKFSSL